MDKPPLTRSRIILAFGIAVVADALQFPITAATATGLLALPGEAADFVVDCIVMVATSLLLGFHWVLLPSLIAELVPGLDLLPTWTGCVAFVVWQRKRNQAPSSSPIIDVQQVPIEQRRLPPPLPTGKADAKAGDDSVSRTR